VKRDPEFFEERPLALIFIGKRLKESLAIEEILTGAGTDYAVEVDYYTGGVIFRRTRAGAFFYVEEPAVPQAAAALRAAGFAPITEETSDAAAKDLPPAP